MNLGHPLKNAAIGTLGTLASYSLAEWESIAAIVAGVATAGYMATATCRLLRQWSASRRAAARSRPRSS